MKYFGTLLILISLVPNNSFANQTGIAIGECSLVINAKGRAIVYVNNICDSKRAAALQKRLDIIAASLTPRKLSPKEQELLANALASISSANIKLISLGEEEARDYGDNVRAALDKSGITYQWTSVGTFSPPPYGLILAIQTDGIKVNEKGLLVKQAFEKLKIPFILRYQSGLQQDIEILVGLRPKGPSR